MGLSWDVKWRLVHTRGRRVGREVALGSVREQGLGVERLSNGGRTEPGTSRIVHLAAGCFVTEEWRGVIGRRGVEHQTYGVCTRKRQDEQLVGSGGGGSGQQDSTVPWLARELTIWHSSQRERFCSWVSVCANYKPDLGSERSPSQLGR